MTLDIETKSPSSSTNQAKNVDYADHRFLSVLNQAPIWWLNDYHQGTLSKAGK